MSANFVANTVTDKLSRNFEYLRISVTDRCNFRCSYCMPSDIFNKDYIDLRIKYLGKLDKLINELKRNKINLKLISDKWIIETL